jgi:hypothetical protein
MRSESERTSSRSSEISSTAHPARRRSSNSSLIACVAPTSRPRVGEATTSTSGPAINSRARSAFWAFPPESPRVAASGPGARMSKRVMASRAAPSIARRLRKNGRGRVSTRFSEMESDGESPVPSRSSGT